MSASDPAPTGRRGLLDVVELIGNKLPDPATLFLLGLGLVMLISAIAVSGKWEVKERLPIIRTEVQLVDGVEREVNVVDENDDVIVDWEETGTVLTAKNVLSRDGLYWLFQSLVKNFINFAPLGVVLVGMLGIGIAERTGLIPATLKAFMLVVPSMLLTPAMIFIGIMSSMTMDAGYVILPPLAAALYKAVGRPPLAGLAAVFAGVAAGFNANLFITGLDPMLAELAETGTRVVDPNYAFNPAANWFFMIASTFVITLAGWAITSWFVERRLMKKAAEDGGPSPVDASDLAARQITPEERKGLVVGGGSFAAIFAIIMAAIMIPGMPLYTFKAPDAERYDNIVAAATDSSAVIELPMAVAEKLEIKEGEVSPGPAWVHGDLPAEAVAAWRAGKRAIAVSGGAALFVPVGTDAADVATEGVTIGLAEDLTFLAKGAGFARWVNAIVPLLFVQFIIPAIVYGVAVRTVKNDRDVAKLMIDSMAAMAPIIVLAFFAAQFIEAFKWSGLDRMLAMAGGQMLGQIDMPIMLLLVLFILMTMFFNMFIGSMSAKYAMFAPIFIPMFMMVGIAPELTQAAYRIGDSVSNIITPLNAYLIIVLVFMQKFVPKGGMGTLISTMLPYTIGFAIVWTIMLLVWVQLGIPLGPDGHLVYPPTP
ncbi:MAG: AbgT family transporter [Phycisphaerales bacterium]